MAISVSHISLFFGAKPNGVLHIGAHEAEEAESYKAHGWSPVIWIEMLPDKVTRLKERFSGDPNNLVFQVACWDIDGVSMPIYRASNQASSSLLVPKEHLVKAPEISFRVEESIFTARLDGVLPVAARFEYLCVDVQGAEVRALRGLGERIHQVKWACVEVNSKPHYEGCAQLEDVDEFMDSIGFSRVALDIHKKYGWGDALYVNLTGKSRANLLGLRSRGLVWKSGVKLGRFQKNFFRYLRPTALLRKIGALPAKESRKFHK